jgi:DNA-binding beta-propeller fold protein YncE
VDGFGTQAQFNTPLTGLAISKSGSFLFVSDFTNSAIRRVDILNHTYVSSTFKGIQSPVGIAIDGTETYLYAISQKAIYKLSLNVASPIIVTDSMIIAGSKSGPAGSYN